MLVDFNTFWAESAGRNVGTTDYVPLFVMNKQTNNNLSF